MDAVDEGDSGGSLNRECKLPLEPFERGSVGDSARSASPADLVRRSSAIFWRRSSGGGSGGWLAMPFFFGTLRRRFASCSSWSWSVCGGSACKAVALTPGDSNFWRTHRVSGCVGRVLALYQALKAKLLSIIR